MWTALAIGGGATALLVVWGLLTNYEERRGERLFLAGLRSWIDRALHRLSELIATGFDFIVRRVVQFTWYYSLQAFLRGVLKLLERTYLYLEARMHLHRKKATAAQSERPQPSGMWSEMNEHKQATALTEAQKRKRKEASLRG